MAAKRLGWPSWGPFQAAGLPSKFSDSYTTRSASWAGAVRGHLGVDDARAHRDHRDRARGHRRPSRPNGRVEVNGPRRPGFLGLVPLVATCARGLERSGSKTHGGSQGERHADRWPLVPIGNCDRADRRSRGSPWRTPRTRTPRRLHVGRCRSGASRRRERPEGEGGAGVRVLGCSPRRSALLLS